MSTLKQIKIGQARIKHRLEELEDLERLKAHVTSGTYEQVRHNIIQAIAENRAELERLEGIINMIPNSLYRDIIRCHWIQGLTLEKTAVHLNYSESHIMHQHTLALKAFEKTKNDYENSQAGRDPNPKTGI